MKLIYDITTHSNGSPMLLEGKVEQDSPDKPKTIKLTGTQIACAVKNVNGRTYPTDVMKEAVDKYVETWINTNRGYGELEHPDRSNVLLEQACDRLTELVQDPENPNNWIGTSIVMASDPIHGIHGTPKGDILAAVLCHGGRVGRSTRGIGDYDEASGMVKSGYALQCIDTVLDPSGPGCMPECIVEGVLINRDFMLNEHGEIVEVAYNKLGKGLSTLPKHDRQQHIYDCFHQFFSEI